MHSIARTSQPRSNLALKASHPAFINNAPLFAYNAAGGLVDIQGHALAVTGAVSFADNFGGYASKVGTGTNRLDVNRNFSPPTRNCTAIIGFVVRSLVGIAPLFSTGNDTNRAGIKLRVNANGSMEFLSGDDVGTNASSNQRAILTPASTIAVNIYYSVVCDFRSATTGDFFVNGVSKTVSTGGTAGSYGAGTGNGAVHAILGSGALDPTDQEITHFILLPNVIDQRLAQSISSNPWQLWEDYHRPMFLDAATSDPIGPLIYSKLTHGLVTHGRLHG